MGETTGLTAAEVKDALYQVIDPELGINVVDLGLIYDVRVENETASGHPQVYLDMTLTTPLCPLSDHIEAQIAAVLSDQFNAESSVNWVWTPPWGVRMVSAAGHEQLRALGFVGLSHEPPDSCDAQEIVEVAA